MNLPEKYKEKMEFLLGSEFELYLKSMKEKRNYGLRVNTLKIDINEFINKSPFEILNVKWCKEGFYYDEEQRPAKHPYYHAGLYYIQEPSAMAPASVLEIQEGDKVLDICGAPGGKSTQLGAKLNGIGVLVANDISAGRTKAMLKNIELFGIKNAIVTSETPEKLAQKFDCYFNKILIDAPCSGEGMFRKEPDVMKSWGEEMSDFCCVQQREILQSCSKMLCEDGFILYSTCTFAPDENEKTINDFLDCHEEFEIINISSVFGFEEGCPQWVEGSREELKGCARLFPHKIKGEGHFLALLHKKYGKTNKNINVQTSVPDKEMESFLEFKNKYITTEMEGVFQIFGSHLYLVPDVVPDMKGIRVIRSGWHLGELKKNRFEPSQAFAMGLKKQECRNMIDFNLEDENVIRYLKGETVEVSDAQDGWCLVGVDGYPLGWGKMQNGRLKNKYYSGWRMN